MGKLVYTGIMSLDGYTEDAEGSFDWLEPSEEVHRFVNDLERPLGTFLLGRRMYDVMTFWETADAEPGQPDFVVDYASIWRDKDKVVYSRTLDEVSTARTRLEPEFDPAAVADLKRSAERDLSVDGPNLASTAIRAGLVDEFRQILFPVIVGGGNAYWPRDVRMDLELVDEHRFSNGARYACYRRR